jgi:DNA modification methylase
MSRLDCASREKEASTASVPTGQMSRLVVLHGDCVERMRTLPASSVQLVVTSPSYDALRTYGGHSWNFEATARELYRVVCDGGVVCWNVGDSVVDGSETLTSAKQKIFFREQCGFRIHDTMIYEKTNFGHPERSRYHQLFEYVFILSKGKPRAFNPICDKRNAYAGTGTLGKNTLRETNGAMKLRTRNIISEWGMRGNVWRGNTAGQEGALCQGSDHPAPMPKWLARDLILSWSNPGDTVLDPFSGSGTTGRAALEHGRKAILIEIEESYLPVIERSCSVTMGLALSSVPERPVSDSASY